jgi:HAD superfamily hydrolase (TIGR01509 family)
VKAAIFDMDGLLLDTEPLWGESMLKIATKHRVNIRSDFFKYTTGLRINEVTAFWHYKFGWESSISSDELAVEIVDDIIALSIRKGNVMPGVLNLLEKLKSRGLKLGVATSSPQKMLHSLLEHFKLLQYFDELVSAENESHGKPHPAVYLKAAQLLDTAPWECVAFEDSLNGIVSAKSARMQAIAIPDEFNINNPKFAIADEVLASLEKFDTVYIDKYFK